MNLATFLTVEEYRNFRNTIVKNNAIEVNMQLFFVGGLKVGSSNWYWITNGTDLDYRLDWGVGEPNNPAKEQCLSFYANGGALFFNDMTCEAPPIRFLCEKLL